MLRIRLKCVCVKNAWWLLRDVGDFGRRRNEVNYREKKVVKREKGKEEG